MKHSHPPFHGCQRSKFSCFACYSVDLPIKESIAFIADWGPCNLLLKAPGLTARCHLAPEMFYWSEGPAVRSNNHFSLSSQSKLTVFRCPFRQSVKLALTTPSQTALAYLSFDEIPWNSVAAEHIRTALCCREKGDHDSCSTSCQKWLDDWSTLPAPASHQRQDPENLERVCRADQVKVSIQQPDLNVCFNLRPSFRDRDRDIIRLSEAHQSRYTIFDLRRVLILHTTSGIQISPHEISPSS